MKNHELNARIIQAGKAFFEDIKHETPSLFDKGRWIGKVLDRCMESEELKTQMFRFVDVFPCLNTRDQLSCHLKEFFGGEDH
jgi:RHH-type proline utilization regulon transcriptional repressor/proline dehydrogenase/delta 1-pyrroline-5-carboxylate dehydrogenase